MAQPVRFKLGMGQYDVKHLFLVETVVVNHLLQGKSYDTSIVSAILVAVLKFIEPKIDG